MTFKKALSEDVFYDVVADSYEKYKKKGGRVLDPDDIRRLSLHNVDPRHIASKELQFKKKYKESKEKIKKRLFDYFIKHHE